MTKEDDQVVLIDAESNILCGTDLKYEYDIIMATIRDQILTVVLSDGKTYSYVIA
jgi:hypothetical protein